jgi:HEAT repeat protein
MDDNNKFESWRRRLASADAGERLLAVSQLPGGFDDEVVELLIGALRDPLVTVRAAAASALRRFKNEQRIEEALGAAVDYDPDPMVRAHAMSSLAEMAGLRGYGQVFERWHRESDPRVKLHAAMGAMQGLQAIAVDEILRQTATNDVELRDAAMNALQDSLGAVEEARRRIFSVIVAKQRL